MATGAANAIGSLGVGKRKRVMPLGSARRFIFEPHGFYDSAAEIFERTGPSKKSINGNMLFTRSKIRCSSIAEWMEIADASTGKPIWRVEARYGDRGVYAPEVADGAGKRGRPAAFLTAIRMYREYETEPTLMLVHRDKYPTGIRDPRASKDVEVYICDNIHGPLKRDVDPDAELNQFMDDKSANRQLMPSVDHAAPPQMAEADESFYFMNANPGEDAFTVHTNSTFTTMTLCATQELMKGGEPEKRVLANLKRTVTEEPRFVEVDSALDSALVIAIFAAVDQLMLSHEAIDYDVEWPADYAYTFDQISHCFGPRKPLRKTNTFLDESAPANEPLKEERGCFGLL
ncbi:hypothetical protein AB1Y20_007841 [Prymnesium parvum]|uniref:Uncharacterized protein n=1 Tax=Prymnesium parvum TaxID=97485 RepID=A0AB34ISQ9_PRYPA